MQTLYLKAYKNSLAIKETKLYALKVPFIIRSHTSKKNK